jgi:hypothetical protein
MHHLSRALATARIEDRHREAAHMRTIRHAHEPHGAARPVAIVRAGDGQRCARRSMWPMSRS